MASFNKEEAIIHLLNNYPDGKSIVMISEDLDISTGAVRRVVSSLLKKEKITYKMIGNTKVYNINP